MFDLQIRPATLDDLETLDSLYFEFWEYHARMLPQRLRSLVAPELNDWGEQNAAIRRVLSDRHSVILLALAGGEAIGMAEIHLRQDDATNTRIVAHRYLYVSCIIVREAWRSHSVGRRLMDEAETWGRGHDAGEVRLDVWEIPDGPLAFYAKRGYQTMKRTLAKPL